VDGSLQNSHNKWVTAKIVFLKELAPEGIRGFLLSSALYPV
jgi:hypothetical protein